MGTHSETVMRSILLLLLTNMAIPTLAADADGFTPLFNGKDFTGWKNQKGGEILDGKTDVAAKRFVIADAAITIDGKSKGNVVIESAKVFESDATLRIELNPAKGCNNDFYFKGTKFDIKAGLAGLKEGEWNTLEIQARGDAVAYVLNGQPSKKLKSKPTKSPLGIRAEFGAIQIRKVEFKE
jgi:hypothetical protein